MAEYIKENGIVKEIALNNIVVGPRITDIDENFMDGLIESILNFGLLEPIVVTQNNNTGKYILIAGNHRKTAYERMKKEYISAHVIENNDNLSTDQIMAAHIAMEIDENRRRQTLTPSKLSLMATESDRISKILTKDLTKAKIEKRNLELAIETAKGKEKEMLQERHKKVTRFINENPSMDFKTCLLKSGYSTYEANTLTFINNECEKIYGTGHDILKKLENADVDKHHYKTLAKVYNDGDKDIFDKIINSDDKEVRVLLRDLYENERQQKQEKKKKIEKESTKIKIERIRTAHYRINGNDFICRSDEDFFKNKNGYNVILNQWTDPTLLSSVHYFIKSQRKFLCISSNKIELDRLTNNIIDKYEEI